MPDVVGLIGEWRDVAWSIGLAILSVIVAGIAFCWLRSLIKPPTSSRALPASGRPTGHRGDTCL